MQLTDRRTSCIFAGGGVVKPLGIAVSASDFNELEGDQTTPKKMGPGGGPTWSQLARCITGKQIA